MTKTNINNEFVTYIIDIMQVIGPVQAKRMFGAHGIFVENQMFALVANNILYLKADDETVGDFREKGLEKFKYKKQGKEFSISYYQAPEEAMENSEIMMLWGNKALSSALRAAAKKHS